MDNPFIKLYRSRISIAIILLVFLLFTGIIGFKIMSDYSWIDAFYMTVITITTVGFGEVQPLDPETKIFTIFFFFFISRPWLAGHFWFSWRIFSTYRYVSKELFSSNDSHIWRRSRRYLYVVANKKSNFWRYQ